MNRLYKNLLLIVMCLFTATLVNADVKLFPVSPLDLRPDNAVPEDWPVSEEPAKVHAAPGRIADLAFALTSGSRPIRDVRIQIDPLVHTDGKGIIYIPDERIRTVVCSYRPKGGLGGPGDWDDPDNYDYIPFLLMYDAGFIKVDHKSRRASVRQEGDPDFINDVPPLKPRDVPANAMRQWYVMIPVPVKNVDSGVYHGTVRAVSGNKIVAEMPLELTVLPFTPLPPAKLYGIYENITMSGLSTDDPRYRLMMEDLVETGIHNPWVTAKAERVRTKDGWHTSFADIEKVMALRYEVGMDTELAVLVWSGAGINFYAAHDPEKYAEPARRLSTWWDVRGFSADLAIYGIDEAHGEKLRENAERYRVVAREGVKVAAACASGYFASAGNSIQYPIISAGTVPDDSTMADVARARKAGATVLNYNEPQLIYHDPLMYRVRAGFNLWNNIYDGWYPFTYAWMLEEGHKKHLIITQGGAPPYKAHGVVIFGKDRLIPQVEWPAVRQGIDDVRYATTLAAQVLAAREKNVATGLVEEAAAFLRDPGVKEDDWQSVEATRLRLVGLIQEMEKAHPSLKVATLARGDVKALKKKVNSWILPDLSFRPFPMGFSELQKKLDEIDALIDKDPLAAMFAGLAAKQIIKDKRASEELNPVETIVAQGYFGNLLLDAEKAALAPNPPKSGGPSPLERNFDVVRDLNTGWVFRPDRGNDGIKEEWFLPDASREGWSPIDVTKFWQRQGKPEWQDLEGTRVAMEGIGWYALTFDVSAKEAAGKNYLWFLCDEEAMVWLNGKLVRVRNEGASVLRWNIPALAPLEGLKAGENTVVIRVYNLALAGGLWKSVKILKLK